ncbi:MAG: response regulator transcription factor [Desulfobulbaceae bacterium]|jgi:DNA-binding response OmpR family regulator|nr:response regulator transcription factor [Desulfobulbaceae bacterium]
MNILIAEDDAEIRTQLKCALEKQHYRVETASDGVAALDKIWNDIYDLVLLDIMMPRLDGLQVLQEIRKAKIDVPVLMLTARGALDDRVQGLDFGADDYLAKPFSMSELLARIRALLRRKGKRDPVLKAGPVTLDTVSRRVTKENELVELTTKEFSILEFLLYNRGRAVSRFSLAEHVWGDDFDPFTMSNFIDVHLKNLRHKLKTGEPSIIRTIRGVGFIIDDESR